jgi:hypothetical protein
VFASSKQRAAERHRIALQNAISSTKESLDGQTRSAFHITELSQSADQGFTRGKSVNPEPTGWSTAKTRLRCSGTRHRFCVANSRHDCASGRDRMR